MHRSEITIDLGALRRNVRTLLRDARRFAALAVVRRHGSVTARSTSQAPRSRGRDGALRRDDPGRLRAAGEYRTNASSCWDPPRSNREVAQAAMPVSSS